MEIIKINDNTWRFEDGMVRFFLLTGKNKALLIDSGMSTDQAREMAEELTDLPLELLNTHADMDHVAGNEKFERFYMAPAEEENYRRQGKGGELVPVKEGDIIDLGDRELEIIDIPGHTPGSIAILDIRNRVLIGGDSVQDGSIYMFGTYRDLTIYPASMRHLLEYRDRFEYIYPSHGSFPVYPELIESLIQGAESILRGESRGHRVILHGHEVMLHRFPFAGFLTDM